MDCFESSAKLLLAKVRAVGRCPEVINECIDNGVSTAGGVEALAVAAQDMTVLTSELEQCLTLFVAENSKNKTAG